MPHLVLEYSSNIRQKMDSAVLLGKRDAFVHQRVNFPCRLP